MFLYKKYFMPHLQKVVPIKEILFCRSWIFKEDFNSEINSLKMYDKNANLTI